MTKFQNFLCYTRHEKQSTAYENFSLLAWLFLIFSFGLFLLVVTKGRVISFLSYLWTALAVGLAEIYFLEKIKDIRKEQEAKGQEVSYKTKKIVFNIFYAILAFVIPAAVLLTEGGRNALNVLTWAIVIISIQAYIVVLIWSIITLVKEL